MVRALVLLVALPLAAGGALAKEKPPMTRDRFLDDAARIIETAVKRKDTEHAVFHGCYDWHSAVHGHWALLRLDRVRGTHEAAARHVAGRLAGKPLEAERALLRDKPAFEMPYGRAWFLRLAIELEQWARARDEANATRLHGVADDVAASLRAWMDARAFDPMTVEYQNHSWAAAQLFAWYAHRADAKGQAAVRAWVAAWKPPAKRALGFALDAKQPEFFSLYGNWTYAVTTTQPAARARELLGALPPIASAFEPVAVPANAVHALGMNWSRAWALARLAKTSADKALVDRLTKAYAKHVEAGLRDHGVHAGRYLAYDHWVPQFAVYALTEGT